MKASDDPPSESKWGGAVGQTTPDRDALTDKEILTLNAAAEQTRTTGGTAWNGAQSWVEKDISKWACDTLRDQILPAMRITLPSEGRSLPVLSEALLEASSISTASDVVCDMRVDKVKKIDGTAQYISSRGKERVCFEFALKLKLLLVISESGETKQQALQCFEAVVLQ